ncbi:uncharacterized protein MELLADRAFT_84464 [Melampsora larici-populina 98AG31]|uniref:CxC1-like cysteine cluster associated with KDZ transposases domain-containing protein n=1 Tax=Melampsora larici-populina (strain 98AG31 / pathotype 3-4-7) TaxID=747676 RepID=F4SC31_MELLP|nr:uncharacterized protein MELLADRAFT_84464 [Melampsora larici-populina 98AG31]EGF97796.1 hypothetical protein MELLADRAFT_84464 [Melampsora larici-populina 98AG31]
MVLLGVEVPLRTKRTKKPTTIAGIASQRFAELRRREDEASRKALLALSNPPRDSTPGHPNRDSFDLPDKHDIDRYNNLMRADGSDPAASGDGEAAPQPKDRTQYYQSVTYQERTLREEAHWQAVLPKVFIAYMPCSRSTYQWCDKELWNSNFNTPCNCKEWQKRTVVVDTIDLEGTAVSLRLLRFHHTLWKHSSVRLAAFVEAINEYLDCRSPLLVIPGTNQPRDLRRCFSAAVDAYREMLQMEDEMGSLALRMNPLDALAATCPSCFGPNVTGKRREEPDHIICLDANFQQRRHLAASAAWRGDSGILPSLFISPATVMMWKTKMGPTARKTSTGQPKDDVVVSVHVIWRLIES